MQLKPHFQRSILLVIMAWRPVGQQWAMVSGIWENQAFKIRNAGIWSQDKQSGLSCFPETNVSLPKSRRDGEGPSCIEGRGPRFQGGVPHTSALPLLLAVPPGTKPD